MEKKTIQTVIFRIQRAKQKSFIVSERRSQKTEPR